MIYAYEYGPEAGYTGAPGDNKTACIASGCHVGTVNAFSGSISIAMQNGNTYTPGGGPQQVSVTIKDPAMKNWGFQMTARLATETKNFTQPGDFAPLNATSTKPGGDGLTQVLCNDDSVKTFGKSCNAAFTLQYIEHTLQGNVASTGTGSYTYVFTWTPPATGMGNIVLYAAGNASNGTRNPSAGHIYTANIALTPAAAGGGPAPLISGGVVNGATFAGSPIAPNTYITLTGTNLATNSRTWAASDFGPAGNQIPTSLDGTSVTVNSKPAFVNYISPTQINVITPADSAAGSGIPVVVTTNGQSSVAAVVTYQSIAPSLFALMPLGADNGKYPQARHQNGGFVGKNGLFVDAPSITTPAQRNEIITLYGTGFGPTTPNLAAGLLTPASPLYTLTTPPVVTIGGISAPVSFAGLAPGFGQVYQFNVTVPNVPDGDQALSMQTGGFSTQPLSITVQGAQ